MDVILKLIDISKDRKVSLIYFSFYINTIQHDLIVTTSVIITSTTIPVKEGCVYYIDRIFLYSLIYMCEMKISYVLDNVKSNK